jgi:hypothetical protein
MAVVLVLVAVLQALCDEFTRQTICTLLLVGLQRPWLQRRGRVPTQIACSNVKCMEALERPASASKLAAKVTQLRSGRRTFESALARVEQVSCRQP